MKEVKANQITVEFNDSEFMMDQVVYISLDKPIGYFCFMNSSWIENDYLFISDDKCCLVFKGTYVKDTWSSNDCFTVEILADPKPVIGKNKKDVTARIL